MRAHTIEIPGKIHNASEDSLYKTKLKSADGRDWGLYVVADGCSGYNGRGASGHAIRIIRDFYEENLENQYVTDYARLVKDSIITVTEKLRDTGTARTTIDLVLAYTARPDFQIDRNLVPESHNRESRVIKSDIYDSEMNQSEIYVAHLGDARVYAAYDEEKEFLDNQGQRQSSRVRQITKDECQRGEPTNYVGTIYIDEVHIEDRINLYELHKEPGILPSFLFFTTDGLISRATDAQIHAGLEKLIEGMDADQILRHFEEIIKRPYDKLLSVPETKIRRHLLSELNGFAIDRGISKEDLVEKILDAYKDKENQELRDNIDRGKLLKYDDTAMILVDLHDFMDFRMKEADRLRQEIIEPVRKSLGLDDSGEIVDKVKENNAQISLLKAENAGMKNGLSKLQDQTQRINYGPRGDKHGGKPIHESVQGKDESRIINLIKEIGGRFFK